MKNFDSNKAYEQLKERYNIHFIDLLIKNGYKVYLFGGSLRDMVLGKDWKDADIRAWIPLPKKERDEKTEALLKEAGIEIKTKIIFSDLFTIYRFLPENSPAGGVIDFTVVSDQWIVGPDFSMNGLYFDLETKQLIDRHNALPDIEAKLIRTDKDPHVQFVDEPQMMFRAVKCACQFGFQIEKNTLDALTKNANLSANTLNAAVDNIFPGMTEWFIGNIFRGLKYDPTLFVSLWNKTGLSKTFIEFSAKRLDVLSKSHEVNVKFDANKKYEYEEAIALFVSLVARAISENESEKIFERLVKLFRLDQKSVYGDFDIDSSKLVYVR